MDQNGDTAMPTAPRLPWMTKLQVADAMGMSPLSVADTALVAGSCHADRDDKRQCQELVITRWFPGLLFACLAYVDGVTLLKCELVGKDWHAAVQDPALWADLYCATWRHGNPLPPALVATVCDRLKRLCRERSTLPLGLSTRALSWVHNDQTLRVHNVSLQRKFSRGCIESMRTDHALYPLGLAPLDAPVFYYEVTIRGCGSVGIVLLDEPNVGHYYGAGSSSHVGWLPGSYGYHGDDGKIYWHDGTAPIGGYAVRYGPTWGDTRVLQNAIPSEDPRLTTIGCGLDGVAGRLFFTKNGEFLGVGPMRVHSSHGDVGAAVSLHHLGDMAELNLGRAPFVFDIETYVDERARGTAEGP